MIKLSRKSFLKTLGLGMSAILLEDFPVLSAFAANENTMIDPHDLVSELNDWYLTQNVPMTLDEISASQSCTLTQLEKDLQALQNLQVESKAVTESKRLSISPLAMLVNYSYAAAHQLSVFLDEGTFGYAYVGITISGKVDLSNNNVVSGSGQATEQNGVNLDSLTIGKVSVTTNSPSTGYVTYSCPCSARFAWTNPYSGVTYSGTASDTFAGSFAAYNYY